MITIKPHGGKFYNGFHLNGHAEYAEHGQDIVCAGVSAMAQMTLNGLMMVSPINFNKADGQLNVILHTRSDASDLLVETFVTSLEQLVVQYPEHIKIEGIEVYDKNTWV